MWHCLQASQVEIEGINCMRKVAIAYMHDQFIDHSPGGLRPLEPLAWAQAQMLRPQGLDLRLRPCQRLQWPQPTRTMIYKLIMHICNSHLSNTVDAFDLDL